MEASGTHHSKAAFLSLSTPEASASADLLVKDRRAKEKAVWTPPAFGTLLR